MNIQPDVFTRYESGARSYCRRFDHIFTSASGSTLTDIKGREYIDFLAACGALNYGHNDPDMSAALIKHIQGNGLSAALDMFSNSKARFLEAFAHYILKPRDLNYRVQFTGPTGTNAVEAAMKLARKVTGRRNIIAFTHGFHGVSLGALAATGNDYHRMGMNLPDVTRLPFENYAGAGFDSAAYLEQVLADKSSGVTAPAAIILETVQGEGGLNVASASWLQAIAATAKKHGALLIVDDVQAGCGRTGTFFSFEPLGVEPDLVVLSKSISGYGLPMALVLIKPEHDQWLPAEHNGTFRGNTHAFVTATVALEKYWADTGFMQTINANAAIVRTRLQALAERIPGAYLKGRGMMQGIDVGSGELADQISRQAFVNGLVIETSGAEDEVVKVLAALNTPATVLQQGFDRLTAAVDQVLGEATTATDRPFSPANINVAA
jgi:diaminobutyrate-2-oxoglutarate transaminase